MSRNPGKYWCRVNIWRHDLSLIFRKLWVFHRKLFLRGPETFIRAFQCATFFFPTEEAFKGGSEEQHFMNNVKRTLVKTYGILFSVLGESGIKHICSLAPEKSNKLNVLFKQYRRFLSIFVTPLRALHMFQCEFDTKSSSFLPSLEWKERKPQVKHYGVHMHQWLIGIILKAKKKIFEPQWGAVVSTDVSQPKDSGVRSPLGTGAFLRGIYAFFLRHNLVQTDSKWKE